MAGGETLSRSARSNPSVTRQPLPCSVPRVLSLPYSRRALSCPFALRPRVAAYPPSRTDFPRRIRTEKVKGGERKRGESGATILGRTVAINRLILPSRKSKLSVSFPRVCFLVMQCRAIVSSTCIHYSDFV